MRATALGSLLTRMWIGRLQDVYEGEGDYFFHDLSDKVPNPPATSF